MGGLGNKYCKFYVLFLSTNYYLRFRIICVLLLLLQVDEMMGHVLFKFLCTFGLFRLGRKYVQRSSM